MTRDAAFWRNLTIIGIFHAAVLFGVLQWNARARKPLGSGVVWMEPGLEQPTTAASPQMQLEETAAEDASDNEEPEEQPIAKDVVANSHAVPTPRATPKKAKPAVTPKANKTPAKKISKPSAKTVAKQNEHVKKSAGASGTGSQASGAGNPSQFSWYGNMLHDRFFSSWDQPTSVVATGAKMSVLVRLRIEKDGRVSSFALVRPSGNVVVDDSVAAVAKRVTQVDPLPAGLSSGGHYDVNINFELNAD